MPCRTVGLTAILALALLMAPLAVGPMVKIFELAFPQEIMSLPSRVLWLVFCSTLTHTQRQLGGKS
jgi:hypothetical protein